MLEELFLDSRIRRKLQDPYKILLKDLKLGKGDSLLDLGCGTGFLTIPASKIVDKDGVVYAVDNNIKYLNKLRRKVTELGLGNIRIINSDAASLNEIKDCSVNKAVMMLSLHHFSQRERALQEAYSKMAENGLLLINEPIKQRTLGHGTDYEEILSMAESIGFKLEMLVVKLFTWKALLRK